MLMGAVLHVQIDALQVNDAGSFVGYGEEHSWTQISGLWRLPYINDLLSQNIDVMHTEKNWGEALFGTIMDIPDKTKTTSRLEWIWQRYAIDKDTKCRLRDQGDNGGRL